MTLEEYEINFQLELEEQWQEQETRKAFLHWDSFVFFRWRRFCE